MLFRQDIEPRCSYCRHSTDLGNSEVACKKRGIMEAGAFCQKFRYEPTKREPEFARSLKVNVSEEDFLLP